MSRRALIDDNPLRISYSLPASLEREELLRSGRPVWVAPAAPVVTPSVLAYRLRLTAERDVVARVHVTADERYELWVDGERTGRGPERGSARAWHFESYDLDLAVGGHVIVARVWSLGPLAPLAQVSTGPGFLLAAEAPHVELLSTGAAPWEVRILDGYTFSLPRTGRFDVWHSGPNERVDGAAYPWGVEKGEGGGWRPVEPRIEDVTAFVGDDGAHVLVPATLPAQLSRVWEGVTVRHAGPATWTDSQVALVDDGRRVPEQVGAWQRMVSGHGPVHIAANSSQQVVLDLGDYVCGYPELVTSGGAGAAITVCWAEALFDGPDGGSKSQRDAVDGRWFVGLMRDEFRPDGGERRRFSSLWWRAGRFVQLLISTADQPLIVDSLAVEETRYPLELESSLTTQGGKLDDVLALGLRALQMCSHETYMDCPYYEQLMYVGDTRLEALTTYTITSDDALPRKALRSFDLSRDASGLTAASSPSRKRQTIPPFALWWVAMVHDFALWRDDPELVRSLLPGVRAVLDGFLGLLDATGLLRPPPGWNFADWTPDWAAGVPPGGVEGGDGLLTWQLCLVLGQAAELETAHGEPELADRYARHQRSLSTRAAVTFWDEDRGLFADDLAHARYSEHTQCLALLAGAVDGDRRRRLARGLIGDPDVTRTTIYFTHYLFEACRLLRLDGLLFDRLQLWVDLPRQGFSTTPEAPEPTRSDCHGWGAHPVFHSFATILGVRPSAFGFREVDIAPLLGPVQAIRGSVVHPAGRVEADLRRAGESLVGEVSLPAGVRGSLRFNGDVQALQPGAQEVRLGGHGSLA